MRFYDIIQKKKHGEELTAEEIAFLGKAYVDGEIPDYQMSAFLMAVLWRGMTDREASLLTLAIAESGDTVDLSMFGDRSVDKHSTGGVGDKTTMIVTPIVAAVGGCVAKMSGRGLGHTGGTIDKLESIPGFSTTLTREQFIETVEKVGVAVIGQSGNLAPLDKKLYALRDVTATVDSVPLITSSVMGKKLAAGSHSIVLDVKYGSGAFMSCAEDAVELAKKMVAIGYDRGRQVSAIISSMDTPLGSAVGNSLEVKEAIETLSGRGAPDLTEVCLALATEMVALSMKKDKAEARELCKNALENGSALAKLKEWIAAQGGDANYISNPEKFPVSAYVHEIRASKDGYIYAMDTEQIGISACDLGAGRASKEDEIDHSAGIIILKKTGDKITGGEVIALLHTNKKDAILAAEERYLRALTVSAEPPRHAPVIFGTVRMGKDGEPTLTH
ncbi:MAG: thymidine phosphorylase [Clostridia bacterium]|nr:thymidine phosphorylase [Clostridia bacterium]